MFFDDVEVPLENLVGEENKGWDYAKFLLGNERTNIARVGASKERIRRIRELAASVEAGGKPVLDDPRFREKLAAVEIELKALELTQMRVVADEDKHGKGKPQPGLFGAQDQGLGNPAGDDGIADGCDRSLRRAL